MTVYERAKELLEETPNEKTRVIKILRTEYGIRLSEAKEIVDMTVLGKNPEDTEEKKKFCTYCGNKLNPEWKACPHCGKDVNGKQYNISHSEVNEGYLFIGSMNNEKRERLIFIFTIIHYVVLAILILKSISHIYREIQDDQNYKFMMYIVRFINTVGVYFVWNFIVEEVLECIQIKRAQLAETVSIEIAKLVRIVYLVLGIWGLIDLVMIMREQIVEIFVVIVENSWQDFWSMISGAITLLVIAGGVNCYWDKKIISQKENEKNETK